MKGALFTISRLMAILLALYVVVALYFEGATIRIASMIVLLSLFLYYSYLTEKKNGFSLGYLFVFIVVYITNSAIACRYTDFYLNKLTTIGEFGYWMPSSYKLYFIVDFWFYIIAIIWLKTKRKSYANKIVKPTEFSNNTRKGFDIGALLLSLIGVLFDIYEATLPLFAYFVVRLLFDKGHRIVPFFVLPILFLLFPESILYRYRLIGIILPVMMAFVLRHEDKKDVPIWKSILITVVVIAAISAYGIISECYKLHYNLSEVLTDEYYSLYFFRHQFYRVFSIWIKLGGYIIHHVQSHDFFYGTTYIKSIINIFGGNAVSLPELSAYYDNAAYAQPGLLVEGYANFGILGALLNICMVFFLMEWMHGRYMSYPSYMNLFCAVVPFSQILLDGGTFNSAIYLIIMLWILYFPNYPKKQHTNPFYNHNKFKYTNKRWLEYCK